MNNNWHKKEKPLLGLTGLGGGVDGLAVVGGAVKTYIDEVFSTNTETIDYLGRVKINKYENIIMSYFIPENLKKNGSYFDKYFSINTDFDKKNLWILIPFKNDINHYKTNDFLHDMSL